MPNDVKISAMAKQTNINIRVDELVKGALEEKAKALGYPNLTAYLLASGMNNQLSYAQHIHNQTHGINKSLSYKIAGEK